MTASELEKRLGALVAGDEDNRIQAHYALRPELVGTVYYDAPLVGIAAADDPIFLQFKSDEMIYGQALRLPGDWLAGAKSVISFFLPYTARVRESNGPELSRPSDEWLHARIEGQDFLMKVCEAIKSWLAEEGYSAIIPAAGPDFAIHRDDSAQSRGEPVYKSSWSERHAAYAAGLGTFSLSKHIITEKGVCGRFGSIITDAVLEPTPRPYSQPYEYCTFCGACAYRCPVDAISVEKGKDILLCADFVEGTKLSFAPRYGCGKCQIKLPCSYKRP